MATKTKSVKTRNKHAGAAVEDSRRAIEALMAVNESLIAAASVCRALVTDARMLQNPAFSAHTRRLLRVVEKMKDGPNVALWQDLKELEPIAQAAFTSED